MMHNFNVSHGFTESAVGTALGFKATVSPHPVLVIESNSSILLFGEIRNTLGGIRLPSQTVCTKTPLICGQDVYRCFNAVTFRRENPVFEISLTLLRKEFIASLQAQRRKITT
jgi:hypothetical protein